MWKIVVIFCCILALFAGCIKKETTAKAVSIEFMHWEVTPEGSKFISKIVEKFEKANPDIKIIQTPTPPGERNYDTKLITRFVGSSSPDIFEIYTGWSTPFIDRAQFLPLDPYIKKSKVVKEEDFFLPAIFLFYYDRENRIHGKGHLYGLPKDLGTNAILYNKDLFDRANLSYPDESWTDEEYLEAAKKLTIYHPTGHLKQIGFDKFVPSITLVIQTGGDWWSEDFRRCLLDTPEAIEAFQLWYDWQEKYRVCLRQNVGGGMAQGQSAFAFKGGKAGMTCAGRCEIPDFVKYIGNRFRWGVAPLPLINNSHREPMYYPSGWAISAFTKHPEEAWRFMEYLGSKEVNIETAELGWNLPARRDVAYSKHFLYHPRSPLHPEGLNEIFLNQTEDQYMRTLNPYIPITRVIDEILVTELHYENIRKDGGKVDNALHRAVGRINKEIKENMGRE